MLHLKGLEVYITIEAKPALIREAGAADALLESGFDDGKSDGEPPQTKVSTGGADYGENCEPEFAIPE